MNTRQRREALGLQQYELANLADVSKSCITRLDSGGDVLVSTRKKVLDTLRKLESEPGKCRVVTIRSSRREAKYGRRRPDLFRARKMLGLTQDQLAAEWKTDAHEISKIESGYAPCDPVLEEMIDGHLRAMIAERGMAWPGDALEAEPPEADLRTAKLEAITFGDDRGAYKAFCHRCDSGILWGPDGTPHKCPLCNGMGWLT